MLEGARDGLNPTTRRQEQIDGGPDEQHDDGVRRLEELSDMTHPGDGDGPMSKVRDGMTVVDSTGEEVGTVAAVQMGDPQAVTTEGQEPAENSGFLERIGEAIDAGHGLPPQAEAQLRRTGYLKIDSKGIASDVYASAEQVSDVSGDTVRLATEADQLYS